MWLLILIAVNINNPSDQPASLQIPMGSKELCYKALDQLKYDLKFKTFKIVGECRVEK
jgi:hypothetical protein